MQKAICRRSPLTLSSSYSSRLAPSSSPHYHNLWYGVDPSYLNPLTLEPQLLAEEPSPHHPLSSLSFTHMYSVLLLLTFIPLLSIAYLHLSKLLSTCFLLSLQITISLVNIIFHQSTCPLPSQTRKVLEPILGAVQPQS